MTPEQEKRFDELFVDKSLNIHGGFAYEELKHSTQYSNGSPQTLIKQKK